MLQAPGVTGSRSCLLTRMAQRTVARPHTALPVGRRLPVPSFGNVSRPALRPRLRVAAASSKEEPAEQVQALAKADEDPSPFFEPLLRSFLLGIGAAALFESFHVASKFVGLVAEVGYHQVTDVLPKVVDQFSPQFVGDHVVAVGCWTLFYVIEAMAVMSVLNKYPNDSEGAARAVKNLVTIPKKMLPLRLSLFKQLLLRTRQPLQPATASAAARAAVLPATATLAPPPVVLRTPAKPELSASSFVAAPAPQVIPSRPRPLPEEAEEGLARKRREAGLKPGELDPRVGQFVHRQNELTGRRSYLKNFWYAAAISERVGEKPVGVEILGEKVVLWRNKDGKVSAVSDVCPHRGAPLHKGWVNEVDGHDCVVCPYHGWAFDGEGMLRDVPAAENAGEWPKKKLIEAYPVTEKGGFVWLFYGSASLPAEERPPIPYVPELDDPKWKPVYGEIEFDCNHWSVFENAIDMAHIHYLHNDTFGNQGQPQIRDMQCTHDAYGVKATFGLHNKPVSALWQFSQVPEVRVTARALLPSTSVIAFTLGNGLSFTTFVNTVPINGNRTVNRFALVRNLAIDKTGVFNADAWDGWARKAMLRILSEDKEMVEQLRPDLLPREISVKADLPQIAFRKLRQEYIDMGYGVLPEKAQERFRSDF